MTYEEADALLRGRCRNRRKIANNTYLIRGGSAPTGGWHRDASGDMVREKKSVLLVRLRVTNVVTYGPDGRVWLSHGGYQTRTTKDRINRFGPDGVRIFQRNYAWFVDLPRMSMSCVPFLSGMEVSGVGEELVVDS